MDLATAPMGREGTAGRPGWPARAADGLAVEIAHLRKSYGTLVAVDDVSFSMPEGEIFGILGPNGAGKTTTVECAVGLRSPDSGTIRLMGLDPQARRDAWELIEGVRDRGVTIVLVTHFMEEAERLCDRVALIDGGHIVALDAPDRLAAQAQSGKTMRLLPSAPVDDVLLQRLPEVTRVEHEGQQVIVTGTGELVSAVILALHAAGIEARDVQVTASSLEDAFVRLTGRHMRQDGEQS